MRNYISNISTSFQDYPDNNSIAVLVWMTGCDMNCVGCHNSDYKIHGYNSKEMSISELCSEIDKMAKRSKTNKLVITGGDCLSDDNAEFTSVLVDALCIDYDIAIYTGYDIDRLHEYSVHGFKYVKCGVYDHEKPVEFHGMRGPMKDDDYMLMASSNQKWYDENYELISKDGVLKL